MPKVNGRDMVRIGIAQRLVTDEEFAWILLSKSLSRSQEAIEVLRVGRKVRFLYQRLVVNQRNTVLHFR